MALIPPFFLDCVVAIGFENKKGEVNFVATGFLLGRFLKITDDNKRIYKIFLITNKHVFSEEKLAWLRFNPEADESARQFQLDLIDANGKQLWKDHPDQDIDLAIIGINARYLQEQHMRFHFFFNDQHVFTKKELEQMGVTEGDGIFALGFPLGLIGEKRSYVIVRQGIIARIRDYLSGSTKEFLIDTSIFPGNSGGPVVIHPELTAIEGTKTIDRASLIGIVSSYVPYNDIAISQQTKRPRIIFEENSGLASVVPIEYALEVIEMVIKDQSTDGNSTPLDK